MILQKQNLHPTDDHNYSNQKDDHNTSTDYTNDNTQVHTFRNDLGLVLEGISMSLLVVMSLAVIGYCCW